MADVAAQPEGFDPDIMLMLGDLTEEDRQRLEPPRSVWHVIAGTIAADRDGQPNRELTLTEADGAVVADISPIERRATTTIALSRSPQPPIDPGTTPWRQWLPVAAAVAIALAGGLVTWAFSDRIIDSPPSGEAVATVELTNDGLSVTNTSTASARLTKIEGQHRLQLDVPDLPDVGGFYEVWIINGDFDGMYSLGVVTGDAAFGLPPTVDPNDFPIVDVSVEPLDGDPRHSGQSIWRGVLVP